MMLKKPDISRSEDKKYNWNGPEISVIAGVPITIILKNASNHMEKAIISCSPKSDW